MNAPSKLTQAQAAAFLMNTVAFLSQLTEPSDLRSVVAEIAAHLDEITSAASAATGAATAAVKNLIEEKKLHLPDHEPVTTHAEV